jgi:Heavy metal associated domain 2
MIPSAVIAHASTGRLRIKITSQRGNLAVLKSHGDHLAACPGVLSIEVNAGMGSLLLLHQTTVHEIAEYARSRGLFSLEELKTRVPSANLRRDLGGTFKSFDRQLRTITDGDLDLSGFAIAALVVAGSAQILTGNAGGIPWYSAYWYAFNLFSKTKVGVKKEG